MPHVRHAAMRGAVYARSYPFWFFHPSIPSLTSHHLLGPTDSQVEPRIQGSRGAQPCKLQAPHDFRSYYEYISDQPVQRSIDGAYCSNPNPYPGCPGSFLFHTPALRRPVGTASLHSSPRAFSTLTGRTRTSQRRCFWLLPLRLLRTERGTTSVVSLLVTSPLLSGSTVVRALSMRNAREYAIAAGDAAHIFVAFCPHNPLNGRSPAFKIFAIAL